MAATVAGIHLSGNHAGRPAANSVPDGSLYSCTTHSLIYQSNFAGNSWATWATLGASPSGSITASGYTQSTGALLGRTTASTGAIEEITVGSGLTLTGGVLGTSGASGLTVQYPALKPATPTDDFDGASLSGSYTAHTTSGSFATTDCMTQGAKYWPGSMLEIQLSGQTCSTLHRSHSNGDLDFQVGGVYGEVNHSGAQFMIGIAALDSAGSGVGVVAYTDGLAYIATITTWAYASQSDNLAYGGLDVQGVQGPMWFRLKRVSGTWTGYYSKSGRAWDKT